MDKHLHIVAPDFPLPSDAGILKDLVFMVRALHANGVKIHLHCFGDGNGQGLAPYCTSVDFYGKKQGHEGYSLKVPYAVSSRSSDTLTSKLMMDKHPILFIGFQTIYPLLENALLQERSVVVRVLRDEEKYFEDLAKMHDWGTQKLFCMAEAFRFRGLVKNIAKSNVQFASAIDLECLIAKHGYPKVSSIAPFTGMPFMMQPEGIGNYCFFYGNLAEAENEYAALWLLNNVFDSLELPFVIAGDNPSATLEKAAHLRMHTCLVANPGEKELQDLIKKAQVNLLPSFISHAGNSNLHQALALGRHVLTNPKGAWEEDIKLLCHIADHPADFITTISTLFNKEIDPMEHEKRASFFNGNYKNDQGIRELIRMLYSHCQ